MNLDLDALPARCDVLVVGAGPAGAAAAQRLARGGREVVLVDAQAFPRDKVCGDGLIPDALRALERLGVLDAVLAEAAPCETLRCVAPRLGHVDVPGRLAVLPRRRLDAIVCDAAVDAGARMHAPVRFAGPIRRGDEAANVAASAATAAAGDTPSLDTAHAPAGGRVVGALLRDGERSRAVACDWLVLASGARPQAMLAASLCERQTPSAVALRTYVRHPPLADRLRRLEVVWHRRLAPGYGWIFPCGDGVFNVGVGTAFGRRRGDVDGRERPEANLRAAFAAFARVHPAARELVERGTRLDGEPSLHGAPLRCSLQGAKASSPGVLAAGEAIGSTYAFTGEGIGKALETGLLAAEAILGVPAGDTSAAADSGVERAYRAGLDALRPRFAVYDEADRANRSPWLVDLVVWSARRSPRRVERMAGLLEETELPTHAMNASSIARRLVFRR